MKKTILQQICFILFGIAFLVIFGFVGPVYSAGLNDVSDELSTHALSTDSNHELAFDSINGVAEGETIVITFASGFDLTSVSEDDIDIDDDGVDLTTASDCTGTDESGVSISTVNRTVTFQICAGDGGAIAAGSTVTIEIGTNATASGTGVNQIDNPGTEGSYVITISGTFADSGQLAVWISDDTSVSVTARVSGGNGNPGGYDTTPPVITYDVIDITDESATYDWEANESVRWIFHYGLTESYELDEYFDHSYVIDGTVDLTGLDESTLYYYEFIAYDFANNVTYVNDSFETLGEDSLQITNVRAENVTDISAEIWWDTNLYSDSLVEYGVTEFYELGSEYDGTDVVEHMIELVSLVYGTTYHYQVTSETFEGDSLIDGDYTFTTLPEPEPLNIVDFEATPNEVEVAIDLTWTSPADDDYAGVVIRRSIVGCPGTPFEGDFIYDGNNESTQDFDVDLGVLYYYSAFAYHGDGDYASGTCDSAILSAALTFGIKAWPEKRVGDDNLTTLAEIEVRNPGEISPVYTVNAWTNESGEADVYINEIPYGVYDFTFKGLSHLRQIVTNVELVEEGTEVDFTEGEMTHLLSGDVNGGAEDFEPRDDYINSLDISTVLNDLYSDDMVTDLNQDTAVNSLDVSMLLTNLYLTGDE